MDKRGDDEREPGQHPPIHEPADPVAHPKTEDTNEYADDRVVILEPDGEPSPEAE
jgi:hypothetical protein